MTIDSHLHLPWQEKELGAKRESLFREMDRNKTDKGIVIADSELQSVIGSVRDCVELFRGDSRIKVIAGISPLKSYEGQLEYCRELLGKREIVGLKVYTGHEKIFCTDESLTPVYDLAAEYRVPVLFHTGWDDPQYASPEKMRELALSRPENIFVYCHCFYPDTEHCFEILGECGNIYFDTSSLADDESLVPQIRRSLEKAISAMPRRIVYGSDFGSCSMEAHLRFAKSLDITDGQRELFMQGNSERLYGI